MHLNKGLIVRPSQFFQRLAWHKCSWTWSIFLFCPWTQVCVCVSYHIPVIWHKNTTEEWCDPPNPSAWLIPIATTMPVWKQSVDGDEAAAASSKAAFGIILGRRMCCEDPQNREGCPCGAARFVVQASSPAQKQRHFFYICIHNTNSTWL